MTTATESSARRERLFEVPHKGRKGGRGYSRLVRSLRLVLPLLAAALLVLAIIWPSIDWWRAVVPDDLDNSVDLRDAQQLQMRNAKLVGSDDTGRPFELSAIEARQGEDGVNTVILVEPTGEIILEDGAHLKVRAAQGHFDRDAERLELTGSVIVEHGDGYHFESKSAVVNIGDGRAVGNDPIDGYGPEGALQGEGFEIIDKGRTVLVRGKSRLFVTNVPDQP